MIMKVLVLYDSLRGSTEKIAKRIYQVVNNAGLDVTLTKVGPSQKLDVNNYDLIFCGSPVIEWLPTPAMMDFLKTKLKEHRTIDILPCAPIKPGKFAVCFCTCCGAHIGFEEAYPTTQWLASFFGHIGYLVLDKMHIPAEIKDIPLAIKEMKEKILKENNTLGRFGNIIGRPNENDLAAVEVQVRGILGYLQRML